MMIGAIISGPKTGRFNPIRENDNLKIQILFQILTDMMKLLGNFMTGNGIFKKSINLANDAEKDLIILR